MKKYRGFTLIEIIIVTVILAVLAVIALPMIHAGFNSYFLQRNLTDNNWQGRLALTRIESDFRNVPSTSNITTATSTQFTFNDNTNTSVSYTLSGTQLQRNALTLANGVASVTFGYYDDTGAVTAVIANIRYISVIFTITQNNTNTTLGTVINLRNII